MADDLFRAVWPVEDDERTVHELQAEALAALPELLFAAAAQQTGPMTFRVATRAELGPAAALAGTDLYLVGVCPAAPWRDDVRRTRRGGYERTTA